MKKTISLLLALLLLLPAAVLPAAAAAEITVYVNVTENGAPAVDDSGSWLAAVPVTIPAGSTVDDALRALHGQTCAAGTSGYESTSMDMFGQYVSKWFGKALDFTDGSVNVAAYRNHSTNSTLSSSLRDGDVVDVCLYTMVSAADYTFEWYGLSWMDAYAVEAAPGESFTVKVLHNEMNMTTFQNEEKPFLASSVTVNGKASGCSVAADGSLKLSFDSPGEYVVCAGGDPAFGTALLRVTVSDGASFTAYAPKGPGRLAASGLEYAEGGPEITVLVTVTDLGEAARSETDGSALIAVPVTVPKGATLDDVLDALHEKASRSGREGYASVSTEMFGMDYASISTWFGQNVSGATGATRIATAWVNRDMLSTLSTPVADGDVVDVQLYSMSISSDFMSYNYEYYGLGFFNFNQVTAGVGEDVRLTAFHLAMDNTTFQWNTYTSAGADVYVDGKKQDAETAKDGSFTLTFPAAGTYTVCVKPADKSYGAAVINVNVEQGATFEDNEPDIVPENVQVPVTDANYGGFFRWVLVAAAAALIIASIVKAVKESKALKKEENNEEEEKENG